MTRTTTPTLARYIAVMAHAETGAVESADVHSTDLDAAGRRVAVMYMLHKGEDWYLIGAFPVPETASDDWVNIRVAELVDRVDAADDAPRELLPCGCYVWEHTGRRCPA
jgi:hypothetical protein